MHRLSAARASLILACATCAPACASIEITRDTATSGRFESSGFAITLFSIDLPKPPVHIARDNASDAHLANAQVTELYRWPDLGWWDWLIDIVGFRYASVSGTWGFTGDVPTIEAAPVQ
jgi:hypothetical protein